MLAFLKSRAVLIFVGLVLLALLLWFAGPYFAFAEYKPLESVVARLVAILVLVVIWAVMLQIRALRSSRASSKLAEGVVAQEADKGAEAGGAAGGSPGDAAQLRKRFEEAVAALRKSKRRGAANLYELPWYVIIGPPGAGKTTVLVNSGLDSRSRRNSGRTRCAESVAPATATGGLRTGRSCWTRPGATPRRIPTVARTRRAGWLSCSCCASSAVGSPSTA
jgi:type VI protein secretion system component VasK